MLLGICELILLFSNEYIAMPVCSHIRNLVDRYYGTFTIPTPGQQTLLELVADDGMDVN